MQSLLEINMSEFRENLGAYLDAAEAGKTIIIRRRGKPSVTLSATHSLPEPIDVEHAKAFRESLGVSVDENAVVSNRRDERY